jgi:small subunit ribosomal protein S3
LLALSAIQKAKAAGVKGIRVWVSGRINGAAQARLTKYSDGPVPLHTLKADIDFASVPAETNNLGKFGIKVWVYKGDIATTQNNNESK